MERRTCLCGLAQQLQTSRHQVGTVNDPAAASDLACEKPSAVVIVIDNEDQLTLQARQPARLRAGGGYADLGRYGEAERASLPDGAFDRDVPAQELRQLA